MKARHFITILGLSFSHAHGTPTLQRLLPSPLPANAITNQKMGESVAASDRYIVFGGPSCTVAPANGPVALNAGAVFVFDSITGAFLKRIPSPNPESQASFGTAIAVDATTLYVSAPYESASFSKAGAVYAIDIASGKTVWKTLAPVSCAMGRSLALADRYVIVGAPDFETVDGVQNAGEVFILDRTTGQVMATLTRSNPANDDQFGMVLAACGSVAVVGSPEALDSAGNPKAGVVTLIDLEKREIIRTIEDPETQVQGAFGRSLAIDGNTIVIGRKNFACLADLNLAGTQGKLSVSGTDLGGSVAIAGDLVAVSESGANGLVHIFNRRTGQAVEKITPTDPKGLGLGSALCWHLNRLVITAPAMADSSPVKGAAFIARGLRPQTWTGITSLAQSGDYAPASGATSYVTFTDSVLDNKGHPTWLATLKGTPSNLKRGAFIKIGVYAEPSVLQNDVLDATGTVGDILNTFSSQIFNNSILQVRLTSNKQAVWSDRNATLTRLFQEGESLAGSGLMINSITSIHGGYYPSITASARLGAGGVTSSSDSLAAWFNIDTNQQQLLAREGDVSPVNGRAIGQIGARLSPTGSGCFVSCMLQGGSAADNAALLELQNGTLYKTAVRGSIATGTGGAKFSTFLGETNPGAYYRNFVMRASLSGCSAAENEGVWSNLHGSFELIARKGSQAPGLAQNVKFNRFIRSFPATFTKFNAALHASVTGPGVTSANDEAVWMFHGQQSKSEILLRKGEPAPGCSGARIGSIQRVEVEWTSGIYVILASLTHAAPGTDQALFIGNLNQDIQAMRRPMLAVRKGMLVNRPGAEQIKSIGFSPRGVNAQGMDTAAGGNQVTSKGIIFTVTYADNQTELLTGWPRGEAP